jgi:hypothetical protein
MVLTFIALAPVHFEMRDVIFANERWENRRFHMRFWKSSWCRSHLHDRVT